ncbi:hypothetical protein TREMEDRAFT_27317 [Tremella mesenterica DSM 1558]|uniref:uncharacterized protein n=1 Tax=Tremella mesenterica (strain ATCC 24925 / CBS 8224 / DSM 1558 / NBRC 9311 / NRRL Y-6157 / RJB 2259-6 / UBC 559-6) TaxID=578456 RepID=UPI0003F4A41F|nr:uncharacterized protein TREMEDRAFT_27317 [Tremella mesenterica DSM 1558]EIW71480.1 hypothetical protein TREMEDRAFT_27317 [Tremella mesenterica DSM 1558]
MIWDAIWYGGRSDLVWFDTTESQGRRKGVTAAIYCEQITKKALKKFWRRVDTRWRAYGGARILEDNVKVHTAQENQSVGQKFKFRYLNHPPSSPDLNPIENCWAYLKRELSRLPRKPTTPEELFETAQKMWRNIPQEVIDRTIDSMIYRLERVRRENGFVTKY